MQRQLHHIFVLHAKAYRETSAIITALSEEAGKVSFVARGIKSKTNKHKALSQAFIPMSVQLSGNNELKTSQSLEHDGLGYVLQGKHLYSGLYINELLMRLLPLEEPLPDLCVYYRNAIAKLSQNLALEPVLRDFEFKLLQVLGFGIDFTCSADNGLELEPDLGYHFQPEYGFVSNPAPMGQFTYKGRVLLDVSCGNWHAESLQAAKKISRQAFQPLLGNKPLKSRELFR